MKMKNEYMYISLKNAHNVFVKTRFQFVAKYFCIKTKTKQNKNILAGNLTKMTNRRKEGYMHGLNVGLTAQLTK